MGEEGGVSSSTPQLPTPTYCLQVGAGATPKPPAHGCDPARGYRDVWFHRCAHSARPAWLAWASGSLPPGPFLSLSLTPFTAQPWTRFLSLAASC